MKLGLLVILFFGCGLHADVMYETTTTTTTSSDLVMGTQVSKRVFIKGKAARVEETASHSDNGEQTRIMIFRFDRGLIWTLDMDNNQYTETSQEDTVPRPGDIIESGILVEMPVITVQQTGSTKKILGRKCGEVVVSIVEMSDGWKTELTRILWVTQDLDGYEELSTFTCTPEDMGIEQPDAGAILDHATCAQLSEHMKAVEGYPLEYHDLLTMSCDEMKMSLEKKYIFTKLDNNPISPMVFEIPQGFTLQE